MQSKNHDDHIAARFLGRAAINRRSRDQPGSSPEMRDRRISCCEMVELGLIQIDRRSIGAAIRLRLQCLCRGSLSLFTGLLEFALPSWPIPL
jgi:hypothetical protein